MLLNILVEFLRCSAQKKEKKRKKENKGVCVGGQQKMWQREMHIRGSFKKSERKTASFIFAGLESAHDFIFVIICQKQHTGLSQII